MDDEGESTNVARFSQVSYYGVVSFLLPWLLRVLGFDGVAFPLSFSNAACPNLQRANNDHGEASGSFWGDPGGAPIDRDETAQSNDAGQALSNRTKYPIISSDRRCMSKHFYDSYVKF